VAHGIIHLILSAVTLFLIGLNFWSGTGSAAVAKFIAANYLVFAIWQVVLAVASDIPNGIFKLFQWIFSIFIAIFAFLGSGL
jgi:hypothetical protein